MTGTHATASVLLVLTLATPAAAQVAAADPVHAGYMRLYSGEREAAYKHFEALHAADPKSLPKWLGLLFAHEARIEVDETLKPSFERGIDAFLQAAEERYHRSRTDTEALFHLMQAYLLRSTYRLDYDKGVFGAARDAAKSKGYAEAYLKLHPEHGDAYFAIGLYNYYVDIAPNFVKFLRVLLFLPSGNRTEGLKQLERAARDGSLMAPLAELVLADIYGSLEGRLREAIDINERLVQQFPNNPDMRFELALRYMHPTVEAFDRAAEQYTAVLNRAAEPSAEHLHARYYALFGMAGLRRNQWRLEEAAALLTPVIDGNVTSPPWVMPNFLLRRANYRALLNDPRAAEDARRVLTDKKMATSHKAAQRQIAFIEGRRKADESTIYAALLPGNRLVVERRWDEAAAVYDTVAAAHPNNWQVKYRRAYLQFARGNYEAAGRGFNEIVASRASMPSWLKAAAMLNLGWTHDLAGRRTEALKVYKRVVDDYESEAAASAARVGLIAPYRRS
jgi:tetratricopeptide (TPR) repeat protein